MRYNLENSYFNALKVKIMKFCKDCIHLSEYPKDPKYWKCNRKELLDVVTGEYKMAYCSIERIFSCGPKAKYFEPKDDVNFPIEPKLTLWQKVKQFL